MTKSWAGQKQTGFTIVELLIVIVVIGILAAIVVVAYNGVQASAQETAIKSDLRNFNNIMQQQKALEGEYPTTLTADMGIRFTRDMYGEDSQGYNARYCRNASTDEYVIVVNSTSGQYYKFNSIDNRIDTSWPLHGWSVCDLVYLSSTNPSTVNNGLYRGTWAAWVN